MSDGCKVGHSDSRMFLVVSFEYRTEVLTIFRTFLLVALGPGFRSGSNSSNDIPWKTERRTIGDVISRKILPRRSSTRWERLIRPSSSKRQFREQRVVCSESDSSARSAVHCGAWIKPRERGSLQFCNKILQVSPELFT